MIATLSILITAGVMLVSCWALGSFVYRQSLSIWIELTRKEITSVTSKTYGAKALNLIEISLDLAPGNASYWFERGRLLSRMGYSDSGVLKSNWEKDYRRSMVRSPSQDLPLLKLANMCAVGQPPSNDSNFDVCQRLYQATFVRNSTYGYAHYKYGNYLYKQSRLCEHRDSELVAEMCREYGVGIKLMSAGLKIADMAKKSYSNCLRLADNYAIARVLKPFTSQQWEWMGLGLGRKGDVFWVDSWPEVSLDLTEAQGSRNDYIALARGLERSHSLKSSAKVLKYYLIKHPKDFKVWESLIRFMDRHRTIFSENEIVMAMSKAATVKGSDLSANLILGKIACRAGHADLLKSFFSKAKLLGPKNSKVFVAIGSCHEYLKKYEVAIEFYKKAIILDLDNAELYVKLGRAYASIKKYQEAAEQLERALVLNPKHLGAKLTLKQMGIH